MRAADPGARVYHRAMSPRHARPDPAALRRAAWVQRLTTALGLGLLGLQVARARPFLTDDTFISLRYAARLLDDKGLTWTDGEAVEGYSNLLWVILMAVAGLVGLPMHHAAVGLGLICAAALIIVVQRALRPAGPWAELGGVVALGLSAPLGAWAQAGLEAPLFALLVGGAAAGLLPVVAEGAPRLRALPLDALQTPALLLCAAVLTRPDAPVAVAGLAAGLWLAGGQDLRAARLAAVISVPPALTFGAQTLFRWVTYGELVPNTAHAKLGGPALDVAEAGLRYLWPYLAAGGYLWLAGLVGAAFAPPALRGALRLLLPLCGLWLVWVVRAGGDHFPAWRVVLVLEPALALLVGAATAALAQRLPGALGGRAGPAQLLCALSLGLLGLWHERAQERAAAIGLVRFGDDWAQRIEPVGKLLKVAFGPHQPLLATCAAGALPYWSELPALDPLGLTNAHIARQRLRPNQQGMHGHEAGDTAYVVAQRPDIFLFCAPRGGAEACLPQEEELLAHPAVQADYVVRWVEGHDPMPSRSGPLFSLTSERIGIQRSEAEVLLPGWLFADDPAHPARLDAAGRLVLRREAGAVALLDKLPVRGPRWRATVETTPPGAAVAAEVVVDGARRAAITLRFDAPATVVAVRLEAVPADEAAAGARPAEAPTAAPPAAIRASSR